MTCLLRENLKGFPGNAVAYDQHYVLRIQGKRHKEKVFKLKMCLRRGVMRKDAHIFLNMLFQDQIDILAEIAVIRLCQLPDLPDHILI